MFDYQAYRDRYSQHILFYEAGVEDRQKVYQARVAVIGLGSIGIEASRLLAIAQVELVRFICWDPAPDQELSVTQNGQKAQNRDCLPRGLAAVRELAAANPSLGVEVVNLWDGGSLEPLLRDVELVLYEEEEDNSERCRRISEVCHKLNRTWIYAQAQNGSGMTVNVIPGRSACIDCIKSNVKPFDGQGMKYLPSVTDLIARTMAQVQAMEALRILGCSPNVSEEVYCFDVDRFGYAVGVGKNAACPICKE